MTDLSPAAQAVLQAACIHHGLFNEEIVQRRRNIAAALRAAAYQAIPLTKTPWGTTLIPALTSQESRDRLLAIAAELKGAE